MSKTDQEYAKEIESIALKAKEWRRENPNRKASVQFNFQESVFVVGTVTDALERNFISADDGGMALIKAACRPDEHTVSMLRMALEL